MGNNNKKIDKEKEIKKFKSKVKNIDIDFKNSKVKFDNNISIIKLSDFINDLRRCRSLLKRLDYKTCNRKGKWI